MKVIKIILFILICIGILWLLILLLNRAFSGNRNNQNSNTPAVASLATYADDDTEAAILIDGPIIANQEHEAVRITVSNTQTRIEVIKGYDNNVVRQETFPNSEASYRNFLAALEQAGFRLPVNPNAIKSEEGQCPLRSRYVYTLSDRNSDIIRSWSSACNRGNTNEGTATQTVRKLFSSQIPADSLRQIRKDTKVYL